MYELITKYTGMNSIGTHADRRDVRTYTYALDLPAQAQGKLSVAYQDSLGTQKKRFIGVNTKRLSTSMSIFKDIIISKHANIEELIVDSPDVPEDLFKLPLNLNWIKFKFIKKIANVSKFKCKSFAFDKCEFTNSDLMKVISNNPEMDKLQLTSCVVDDLKLDGINVDELHLVYTTSSSVSIPEILGSAKFKKLVISGDLLSDKSNKEYINNLKRSGIKVETVGLVI